MSWGALRRDELGNVVVPRLTCQTCKKQISVQDDYVSCVFRNRGDNPDCRYHLHLKCYLEWRDKRAAALQTKNHPAEIGRTKDR